MKSSQKTRLLVIGGAIIIFVLLFFVNKKPDVVSTAKPSVAANSDSSAISFDQFIEKQKASVGNENATSLRLEALFGHADQNQKINFSDSLINCWDSLKKPAVAAFYAEKKAGFSNAAKDWYRAGDRYYKSAGFVDPSYRPMLFDKAMDCLNKCLVIEPGNLEAQVDLGVCYVESSTNPMKGISLLKGVLEKDSNNVDAQLNLGFFSVKSGQYDKALYRFQRVLQIDPTYLEAYLFLEDVYEKMGNKTEAIVCLKKYVSLVDDPTIRSEVKSYINKLENS
ncbi:MAG TPA: tetratricopeptide repeat protein [Bacteroidia bacterium]|nr:tetratricopeptide repeat protein [Bacteroidia bacterium]